MINLFKKVLYGLLVLYRRCLLFTRILFAIKKWLISDIVAKNLATGTIEIAEMNVFINRCLCFAAIWILAAVVYGTF